MEATLTYHFQPEKGNALPPSYASLLIATGTLLLCFGTFPRTFLMGEGYVLRHAPDFPLSSAIFEAIPDAFRVNSGHLPTQPLWALILSLLESSESFQPPTCSAIVRGPLPSITGTTVGITSSLVDDPNILRRVRMLMPCIPVCIWWPTGPSDSSSFHCAVPQSPNSDFN